MLFQWRRKAGTCPRYATVLFLSGEFEVAVKYYSYHSKEDNIFWQKVGPVYQINLDVNDIEIYSRYYNNNGTTLLHFYDNYNLKITSLSWSNALNRWDLKLGSCFSGKVNDTLVPLLGNITWTIHYTNNGITIHGNDNFFTHIDFGLLATCSDNLSNRKPKRLQFDRDDKTSITLNLIEGTVDKILLLWTAT